MAVRACHREDLFCSTWVEQTRSVIHLWLGRRRDADFDLYCYLGKGVTLGVDKPLPHVPGFYDLQTPWRLQDDFTIAASLGNGNYSSVEEHALQAREQFLEEVAIAAPRMDSTIT